MVKKIILHSIGNQGDFNYYVFDKKQEVIEILNKILVMEFNINWDFSRYYKKISKKKDVHDCIIYGDKIRADVFFGNQKIFLTINFSELLRLKFNEVLSKYATMPKYKFRKNARKNKNKEETIGPFQHTSLK